MSVGVEPRPKPLRNGAALGDPLTVLVLAVGGNVSQGILKALAMSDTPCRVLGADINAPQLGLYTVDKSFISPWAHEDSFFDWLCGICREESVNAILSGAEPVLKALAARKQEIQAASGAVCVVSEADVIELGEDKYLCSQWLDSQGFAAPRYAVPEEPGAVDALVEACGFPLIAKPRIGGGARGLMTVSDARDLEYVCGKPGYLLQEHVGADDLEYTVGCFCDKEGALIGSIAMRRVLLSGTTYRAVLGDFPEVRAEAERIALALLPMGPCNVQLRMTDRGPVCFEINPRFSGTTPIRAHYGFNEVDAALRHFVLDEEDVTLPLVTEGLALRYWNEMYIDPAAHAALEQNGTLESPRAYPLRVEDYGMRS